MYQSISSQFLIKNLDAVELPEDGSFETPDQAHKIEQDKKNPIIIKYELKP
jgi:hypothetical protein